LKIKFWAGALYALLGLGAALNGLWMLLAPEHWYARVPGVTDTGPLNQHLVRDFGACYLLVGAIIVGGLARGQLTRAVHVWITLFFSLHAAIHVGELLAGRVSSDHWVIDFPGVFLPLLLLLVLSPSFAWQHRANA
jgi:uncharacterized protein YjeT (DUF2065 family)